ncbi:hypothetical protein ACFLZ7_03400 [Nanoarchaeota archaeon]
MDSSINSQPYTHVHTDNAEKSPYEVERKLMSDLAWAVNDKVRFYYKIEDSDEFSRGDEEELADVMCKPMGLDINGAKRYFRDLRAKQIGFVTTKKGIKSLENLAIFLYVVKFDEDEEIIQRLKKQYPNFNFPPERADEISQII